MLVPEIVAVLKFSRCGNLADRLRGVWNSILAKQLLLLAMHHTIGHCLIVP